jgi:hypothetical protein
MLALFTTAGKVVKSMAIVVVAIVSLHNFPYFDALFVY